MRNSTTIRIQNMPSADWPNLRHHTYNLLLFVILLWLFSAASAATNTTSITVKIGVVLDMQTMFGHQSLSSILMTLEDFYNSNPKHKTRISLHVKDSKQDVVAAASAALDLIKNDKVEAIIGPGTSPQAHFLLNLGDKAQVPIISFSATSPALSPVRNPYFLRATQNDSAQVKALISLIEAFGWCEVVPVYVQDEFGEGIVPFLTDALQEVDCRVPYRSAIAPGATEGDIQTEMYRLMTMQTRVFVVHMMPELGSRVFRVAEEMGMMNEGFVWIVTDGIGNELKFLNSSVLESMKGVLGVQSFVPRSVELGNFTARWRKRFQSENSNVFGAELDVYGVRAHDAVVALAMAVEEVFGNGKKGAGLGFRRNNVTVNSTDLEELGVSHSGPMLREALLKLKFEGFTGSFHFLNGEVPPLAYQIVNVDENGGRGVGFWTPGGGIARLLNLSRTNVDPKPTHGPIIWPGESRLVPKGWAIPITGKKLRVGVPVKDGFLEFVKVTRDPTTHAGTKVSGYCIDVFEAVMQTMPYAVPFEYIPFALPNGTSSGSYNDLTYQVFLGNFDAVVGDVTIVANRSRFVDFTLPYTESGVSMIVPIKEHNTKNAWVFLKPLTWELWFTSFCFFIFIGFVIWVLEHRTNKDFRGPPSHQMGVMFWFSFSTMVFAHKEKVVSNFARFVVIVWFFVVLILTQTYTASLTSMLTLQKLQPTVTDVSVLLKNGDVVGTQKGSFVLDILKQMKFDKSKVLEYDSLEALEEAFSKGSANGGVAAVFDEIPYMRLFLGKHCSKYAMVGPTYKTDGFGFVFPKLSPLAPDVSRAILNVTQGDQMEKIEKRWFGKQASCPDGSSTPLSSSSIGLDSFWGLFLIAGIASGTALIHYAAVFVYQHRKVMSQSDDTTSLWRKVVVLSRHFDEKDKSSHTFKKYDLGDNGIRQMGSADASPQTDFTFYGDQGTPSHEPGGDWSVHSPGQTSPEQWVHIDLDDTTIQESPQTLGTH